MMCGAFISYTFKPQLKTVGPKYGKLLEWYPSECSSEVDGSESDG